jgi:kynurenine 3-monooxygenase
MAIYLARRGFKVEVYERRLDMRNESAIRGRSINMTLAERGLESLREVGLLDKVMDMTIPLKGRAVHNLNSKTTFQAYGKDDHEVIHSILRNQLNIVLMDAAEASPNVTFHFGFRCVRLDKNTAKIDLINETNNEMSSVQGDFIIGADGAFSTIRQQMHRGERAQYQQDFLAWGYKELTVPPDLITDDHLDANSLHVWPRGDRMLMAMPNSDGSFTCTCILPFEGEHSFASLKTESEVLSLFEEQFPDAVPMMPNLTQDFLSNPSGEMITTLTLPWHYKDRVVLIGDACHAVVPFYGQGMNAAFEDCSVLDKCIARHGNNLEAGFAEYQNLRKRHTDVLAELSKQNFVELRERVRSPLFVARKKLDVALNRIFPKRWIPLYTLMAHTTVPYADALEQFQKRERKAKWMGINILLFILAGGVVAKDFLRKLRDRGSDDNGNTIPFWRSLLMVGSRSNRDQ